MSNALFIWVFLLPEASGHVPETITVGPTADWCQAIRTLAAPADRVLLLPGHYPGGCELDVGGLVDLNEALLVTRAGPEPVIIEADEDGLSLRITGEPTRIYDLTLQGRVEAVANNVTIDTCEVSEILVTPGVNRSTVVWSTVDQPLSVESVNAVIRGNRVPEVSVSAEAGLVADNTVDRDVFSTVPTHRNFVGGALRVEHDAFANVVVGLTQVDGALYGNTLLGEVLAADARNNLTVHAELSPEDGNLRCADCVVDLEQLDVRPTGAAASASSLVEAPGDSTGFCLQTRSVVGAVGLPEHLDRKKWTVYDREREGCVQAGSTVTAFPPPSIPAEPVTFNEGEVTQPSGCSTSGGPNPLGFVARIMARR